MPAGFVAELLFQFLLETVGYVVFYLTGRAVVSIFTFGSWDVEDTERPKRGHPKSRDKRVAGLPPRTISVGLAMFIGAMFWALVVVVAFIVAGAL